MTRLLFREDAYLHESPAVIVGHTLEGGILLDQSIFYPTGGGQPGDSGWLLWPQGRLDVATTIKQHDGQPVLVPADLGRLPPIGTALRQVLDWERRHRLMRMHTALHLLSVVVPLPVTGGQIGAEKGRLDFDMPEGPSDAAGLEAALNDLVDRDLPVRETWISAAELAANPGLVKTLRVKPPAGQGRIRLVRIGEGAGQIDLQPCGGTHVARTGEIGSLVIDKIDKKGRMNRRISIRFAP